MDIRPVFLFDLDGTLIDSAERIERPARLHAEAYRAMASEIRPLPGARELGGRR